MHLSVPYEESEGVWPPLEEAAVQRMQVVRAWLVERHCEGSGGEEKKALTSLVYTDARGSKVVHGAYDEKDDHGRPGPADLLGHHAVLEFLQDADLTAFAAVTVWFLVGVVGYLLRRKGNRGSTHMAFGRCSREGRSASYVGISRGRR